MASSVHDRPVAELERTIAVLERRIALLSASHRDMRLLLDQVAEGFFTVDAAGTVSDERSAAVDRWLGPAERGMAVWEYLGRVDREAGLRAALAWQLLGDDVLPPAVAIAQLPNRFHAVIEGVRREFRIGYRLVDERRLPVHLLVVLTDVTIEEEKKRTEEREREVFRALQHVVRDRDAFFDFLDEADGLVDRIDDERSDRAGRQRALHTLKGTTGLFGFWGMARLCHEVEGEAERSDAALRAAAPRVREAWEQAASIFRPLRARRTDRLEIDRDAYDRLVVAARASVDVDLAEGLRLLGSEPLGRRLTRLGDAAVDVARRLEREIDVTVDDDGLFIDHDAFGSFFFALIHVVRNAVDHGLEGREEREMLGKPARGQLLLSTRLDSTGELAVVVRDDGRGVDWEAVSTRAAALGLPVGQREQLISALSEPGFTTRREASETAGRGIGLSAVVEEVRASGGRWELSTPDTGTELRFLLPAGDCVWKPRRSTPGR